MRYRLFGQHTGLRVSELVLGTANFGGRWGYGADLDAAREIVDRYADAGGNFLDCADVYQFGESEEFLGKLLTDRRDNFVIATKYTQAAAPNAGTLATGNSRLAMRLSVEASLRRLKTDRIDLYWVHFSDGITPVDEIMRGPDDLVRSGKVLYIGLSDFPAWRVARAATIAELRGWARVAGLQFEHSLVERTSEHELMPAGKALGLGMVAWSPLGGGLLSGKYRRGEKGRLEALGGAVFQQENSSQRTAIVDATLGVATELGVSPSEVAVAWVLQKGSLPIIGPRTSEQLTAYLGASKLRLAPHHVELLDRASALSPIFPQSMIDAPAYRQAAAGGQYERVVMPETPAP
ncbi:aryl-alcohol dehydrogenase-like predicted oxidoreductase [Paraburkholderia sp. BL6669N2]|uniref:aldo/keto reductase n=1 Tax=Paraburkholderia sp. BL6669N2 TaxID=1938807 RepID=UPI000E26FE8D|nr:aldo/keto reductase [Paraburkholderia sp. BL6669N2]REG48626.1 aryl-alcohol dehydrogenase-like predicted oxidoreductase [Paraburkholderia sp. BL6669N2]